ncbi:MAG: FAD-dependent monooxygenase [Mucilaginibacter sp.]
MVISEQHAKVLIVGAGPSGLMMAAQLLRHGVQPVIIDSRKGPTDQSKALAVQARTLEIYRQLGIADRAVNEGKIASGLTFNQDGKKQASVIFEGVGNGQTPFPYILLYQQSKNERLLLNYLTQNTCPVYWDTNLLSLTQCSDSVTAQLKHNDTEYNLIADWVVGADGAHSAVRHSAGISFTGDTYPHKFYLADVELDNEIGDNLQIYLSGKNLAAFFPMPEKNNFRIIGSIPRNLEGNAELELDEILPHLNKTTGYPVKVARNKWFTLYKLHHRMADNFREQRCFLIGDAAHIHSPVGGQGMNTGLQDAYNLGWKLAGAVTGKINTSIVSTYADERQPVARQLLNTTDRAFNFITSEGWLAQFFKKWVMAKVVTFVWGSEKLRKVFFKTVSQTGIDYRESRISLNLTPSAKIQAGDRLPYIKIYDEKQEVETDLHAWCAKPGFTLIMLGKLPEIDVFALAKWITQKYNGSLNLFYLPPSAKNSEVYDVFEIKEGQKKALIVRPDMHIGFITDVVAIEVMDNYLVNVVGFEV